jgi:glycerol-3-phosphate dehydrogenase
MEYDVIVIGGGAAGSAVARFLSQYEIKTAVFEKNEDVGTQTTKANSGIIHAGFDALPGTLKARYNVEGANMMPDLSKELDIDYIQNGSLVLCFDESQKAGIEELYQRGLKNGVKDLTILSGKQVKILEPNISEEVVCALYAPTAGIVDPFSLCIAMAENAAVNGVQFYLNTPVEKIEKIEGGYRINDSHTCKILVNAAGVYAGKIHEMALHEPFEITPRKGEYYLLDKSTGSLCRHTLFQQPGPLGKGVLVTPTVHGNILVGPNAADQQDFEDVSTTRKGLQFVASQAKKSVPDLPVSQAITSFAGLRAVGPTGDFIIGFANDAFFDVAGIESPGLTSAPAIGKDVAKQIAEKLQAKKKAGFQAGRKGYTKQSALSQEELQALIEKNPAYGKIICRCESISLGQIQEAVHAPIPALTTDAIKRRVRAGMGRCQGGFCLPKVMHALVQESGQEFEKIQKSGPDSYWLVKDMKGERK